MRGNNEKANLTGRCGLFQQEVVVMRMPGPTITIGFCIPESWNQELEDQVTKKGCRSKARLIRMAIQHFIDMPEEYVEEGKR